MKVTALAGGVGGAKLLVGLQRVLHADLTAIINTGDDASFYGVQVSPDIDICCYWLAGIADRRRGWGIREDTFTVTDGIGALGAEAWFRLGDRDFATCLYRTEVLHAGGTLSGVTDQIRRALGVEARLLPMSDDAVRTRLVCDDGRKLEFQEYFVRERCEPTVREVRYAGVSEAKPAPGVVEAIERADVVVVCPSNPLLSIGPILALNGIRHALKSHRDVVAVTPIVRGAALKGPADRILTSTGGESSASGVASMYADFVTRFVVDASDPEEVPLIEHNGMRVQLADTIMTDDAAAERLARTLLGR